MNNEFNTLERELLREQVGEAQPRVAIRSSTKIEGGRWWIRTRTWICVMAEEVILMGIARRRLVERLAIKDCAGAYYNHSTGELVIPDESLELNHFAISPSQAIRLLNLLHIKP